jgi:hypothetical protein
MPTKSVLVRLRGDNSDLNRALLGSAAAAKTLGRGLDDADDSGRRLSSTLETSNDRTTMLIQSALALGPALVPLGAQAVPIVAGLTAQLGAAAGAAGVTVLAFQGVGDAVKALRDYELEPTEAHLQKMQETFDALGPAGRDFARTLNDLREPMQALQDIAQAGMFPGMQDGIEAFSTRLPEVERLISTISRTLGKLSREAGESLAGPEWDAFFTYMEEEARPLLLDLSRTVGNLTLGFANMMQAFGPMSTDFSNGFLQMSRDFADWSAGLESNQGFQAFSRYIEETGPKVWDALGAIAAAMLAIVEAAAPIGEASLPIIEAFADAISAIAATPIGPVLIGAAAGFSAIARAVALFQAANGSSMLQFLRGGPSGQIGTAASKTSGGIRQMTADLSVMGATAMTAGARTERELNRSAAAAGRLKTTLGPVAKAGGVVGGLALATSGLSDQMGMANTASLAMMGTLVHPWGAAVGAGIGLTMDFAAANNGLEDAIAGANRALESMNVDQMKGTLTALDEQIAATQDKMEFDWSFNPVKHISEGWGYAISKGNDLATGSYGKATEKRDELTRAIERAAEAESRATIYQDAYTGAVGRSGIAAGLTTSEVNGLVAAMEDQTSAALAAFDAVTQYRQALKDARAQAAKTEAGINGNSDAALENRAQLSRLAAAWNNQSDAVRNNTKKFKEAKDEYVAVAVAMGVPIDKAKELARRFYEIPDKKVIEFAMTGGDKANDDLERIRWQMAQIHDKDVRLTYYVNTVNASNIQGAGGRDGDPSTPQAGGGFVPKTGLPYADRHRYLLADGEGITTNRHGETDRFKDVIAAINAGYNRSAIKGMLADGGFAGHPRYVPPPQPAAGGVRVTVAERSLAGLRIEGALEMTASGPYLRGVVRQEIAEDKRFDRVKTGG